MTQIIFKQTGKGSDRHINRLGLNWPEMALNRLPNKEIISHLAKRRRKAVNIEERKDYWEGNSEETQYMTALHIFAP